MKKWTDADKKEVLRLWDAGHPARQIGEWMGVGESSIRHVLRRHFDPFAGRKRWFEINDHRVDRAARELPPAEVIADRNRRVELPDTLDSLFGDPKPGSGQSALEQMRR